MVVGRGWAQVVSKELQSATLWNPRPGGIWSWVRASATHQKHHANHMSNFKFSSSHIKISTETREIILNDTFYLT